MTAVRVQTILPDVRNTFSEPRPYHLTLDWKTRSSFTNIPASSNSIGQCTLVPNVPQHMDPPRPLEPRFTHERSSSIQKSGRDDPFSAGNVAAPSIPRQPSFQGLPGVKALLSPIDPNNGEVHRPPTSHESWHIDRSGPSQYHHEPPQHSIPGMQPPQQTHLMRSSSDHLSNSNNNNTLPSSQDRRVDLPVLETAPRHALHQHPHITSPRVHQHSEASRDYIDNARPRQQSAGSYGNSASSPFTPAHFDNDTASRGSGSAYDRSANPGYTPTNAESSRRYIGVRDFPGEGQFHVYEGGTRLPTHVDGEQVNPQWGLTKANKPRKRLALACLDCREKKIKCEPGVSSCLQCEKAKRPCRRYVLLSHYLQQEQDGAVSTDISHRNTNPQGQHNDNASIDWSSNADSPPASRPLATPQSARDEYDPISKRRAQEELSSVAQSIKRQKSLSPNAMLLAHGGTNGIMPPPSPAISKTFFQSIDPFAVDPSLTIKLLETYFSHINNGVYRLFPRETFLHWVTVSSDKSPSDRMVLHAMMAMGSVFSPPHSRIGVECAHLAAKALQDTFGRFSLQVIHARLLLGLYHFAVDIDRGLAWEHCGGAMRAISALRYNDEEGCALAPNAKGLEDYDLSHKQIIETRRRTVWCGFMMDRLHGFGDGMLCTVNKADIFLRLPCTEFAYQRDTGYSPAPFFDNGLLEKEQTLSNSSAASVSSMAHLLLISAIWGNVMEFVHRGIHRATAGHAADYEVFYAKTQDTLQEWLSRLPEHLRYNEANIARSLQEDYAGDLVTMHILYHYARLKLNRSMRFSLIQDKLSRNICEAHIHAHQLLGILVTLDTIKDSSSSTSNGSNFFPPRFSTPFIGNAVVSAIDVVSAGGHDSTLKQSIEAIRVGLDFLRELQPYWSSAASQVKQCQKRYYMLNNVITRPYKASGGCWLGRKWGLEHALETEMDAKNDCIYGIPDKDFYEAIDKMTTKIKSSPSMYSTKVQVH